jgi:hypothetical protein
VDRCYFAKEPPAVELRGGLVFIRPAGATCEVAVSPHNARLFAVRLTRLLDQFDRQNTVVPMRAAH